MHWCYAGLDMLEHTNTSHKSVQIPQNSRVMCFLLNSCTDQQNIHTRLKMQHQCRKRGVFPNTATQEVREN